MNKYHCPRCKLDFFQEEVNINFKHQCGEFACLDWHYEEKEEENGTEG